MQIDVIVADYSNERHGKDLSYLLNIYACDIMGGGNALPDSVQENIVSSLSKIPHAMSLLCYVDDKPAGFLTCFEAFSTFKCKPLINIHDLAVLKEFRGMGLSQLLLEKLESIARAKDCCKITLEVLEGNEVAQNAYLKYGFSGYELDPVMGRALFWEKPL